MWVSSLFLAPNSAQAQTTSPYSVDPTISLEYLLASSGVSALIVTAVSAIPWIIIKKLFKRDIQIYTIAIPLTLLIMAPFHPITMGIIVGSFLAGYINWSRNAYPKWLFFAAPFLKKHPVLGSLSYVFLTMMGAQAFSYGGALILPFATYVSTASLICAGDLSTISPSKPSK